MRLVSQKIAAARAGSCEPLAWMENAVVFVPEATPVLRQAESGLTAAESVEYFGSTAVASDLSLNLGPFVSCIPNDPKPHGS
jgi:hypothetical protein